MTDTVTILLIDDDPSLRKVTSTYIRREGYEVIEACDGQQGYELACQHEPALILSDVMMPRVNGLDLLKMVRNNDRIMNAYFILLTAKDRASDILEGFSAKADDYITKPFSLAELMARVQAGLRIQRLQMELSRNNKLLEESMALQARFFGMATHDLRAPLSIITTYTSLLGQGIISDDEIQQVCTRRAQEMMRLIDDVLNLTRFEAGTIKLHSCLINIIPVVHSAVLLYEPVAKEKNISLHFDCEGQVICGHLDAKRISEVFENLISNAIKYSYPNGSVTISLSTNNESIVATVSDAGHGIPPAMLTAIFEPFAKTEANEGMREGHSGLGLAIVKRLVELHRGRVVAESRGIGFGSTFRLELPKDH